MSLAARRHQEPEPSAPPAEPSALAKARKRAIPRDPNLSRPIEGIVNTDVPIRVTKLQGLPNRMPLWPQGLRMSERDLLRDADLQEIYRRYVSTARQLYTEQNRSQWLRGALAASAALVLFTSVSIVAPGWPAALSQTAGNALLHAATLLGAQPPQEPPAMVPTNTAPTPQAVALGGMAGVGSAGAQTTTLAPLPDTIAPGQLVIADPVMPRPFPEPARAGQRLESALSAPAARPATASAAVLSAAPAAAPVQAGSPASPSVAPASAAPVSAATSPAPAIVPTGIEEILGANGVMLRLSTGQVRMYRINAEIAPGETVTSIDAQLGIVKTTRRELRKQTP